MSGAGDSRPGGGGPGGVGRPAGSRGTVQSVERALDVVAALAARGGVATPAELAADTGLAAATLHRICSTLVETGHLRRGAARAYLLGPRLHRTGLVAARVTEQWARPALQALVDATGETANLAVREGDGVVYLAQVPSPHSMRMFTEVGRRVEIHCTAVGKALAAELDDSEIRELLGRTGMPRYTSSTIDDPDAYLAEIAEVRARGFGTDESEQEEGVRCVALRAGSGGAAIALSVSGPEARFTRARRDAAVDALRQVVRGLPQ